MALRRGAPHSHAVLWELVRELKRCLGLKTAHRPALERVECARRREGDTHVGIVLLRRLQLLLLLLEQFDLLLDR